MKVQTYKLSERAYRHVKEETRWWESGGKCYVSATPLLGNVCGSNNDLEKWLMLGELIPAEVVEVADEPAQLPLRQAAGIPCYDIPSNTYAGIDRSKPDEWGVGLPSRAKPIQDAAAAHERQAQSWFMQDNPPAQNVMIDKTGTYKWTFDGSNWTKTTIAGPPLLQAFPKPILSDSIAALEQRANQVQNVSPFAASVARCDKEAMR